MKCIFEEKDIKAGMYVTKDGIEESSLPHYTFKIGYIPTAMNNKYALISMTDGMTNKFFSKGDLVKFLNERDYIPMIHKDLIKSMELMRDWYN